MINPIRIILLLASLSSERRPALAHLMGSSAVRDQPFEVARHSISAHCTAQEGVGEPIRANLFALAAGPEKYDGCLVKVAGFLLYDRESTYLFPSRDFSSPPLFSYGLQVVLGDASEPAKAMIQERSGYVMLTGRFSAVERVRGAGGIGALYQISSVIRLAQ